jgi:hypothetical protein
VNTIYGRWWHPLEERAGVNPVPGSPLPWTGDYEDGLGNPLTMLAYANPGDVRDERQRGDGYGLAVFRRSAGQVRFECWPRFSDVTQGDSQQFPGWPVTVRMEDNDGRAVQGHLPELRLRNVDSAVVQVIDESTGEVLYTQRRAGPSFRLPVYGAGPYRLRVGRDVPGQTQFSGLRPGDTAGTLEVEL